MRRREDYLQHNREHRIKRAEALDGKMPGEVVIVDGIEYWKVKQSCVNCTHLYFSGSQPKCRAWQKKITSIESDMTDCEFWKFRDGEIEWK